MFVLVIAIATIAATLACGCSGQHSLDAPYSSLSSATAETSSASEDASVVGLHGQLKVDATSIVDEHDEPFRIRGISTHGLAWYPQYVNADAFSTWGRWGANTIRLALYTEEAGGWCETDDAGRASLLDTVCSGVDDAIAEGLYVIVDWHILADGNPQTHEEDAKVFFQEVSSRYPASPNVIFEICNEPNGGTTWDDVFDYASDVIPVIRANSPEALIVVGTPTWSQDVDEVASRPLPFDNVVYSLHFYAATHKDGLRSKAQKAIDAGVPLLVSEFGICDATGGGTIDTVSADEWLGFLDANDIGYVCWNLSNKQEASALISDGCAKCSGWDDADLSQEGAWYKSVLEGSATTRVS